MSHVDLNIFLVFPLYPWTDFNRLWAQACEHGDGVRKNQKFQQVSSFALISLGKLALPSRVLEDPCARYTLPLATEVNSLKGIFYLLPTSCCGHLHSFGRVQDYFNCSTLPR